VLFVGAGNLTNGRGTLIDELIGLIGGVNVASEAGVVGFNPIGDDAVAAFNPDVVVMTGSDKQDPRPAVVARPGWRDIAAVRTGRVKLIRSNAVGSISHHILVGADELSQAVYADSGERFQGVEPPPRFADRARVFQVGGSS
jgi:iron complex transport system substrate-binding protein